MQFAQPQILSWLWSIVLLIAFFGWTARLRRQRLNRFAETQLIDKMILHFSRRRFLGKQVLLILVFILSMAALARPQWGFEWQEVRREGLDILVAIDISKSMLTEDVKPNRLERSKLAVRDLLKKVKGDRIGIIAFAGDAFLMCPLTVDDNGVLLTLEDLDVSAISRGGTNIGAAMQVAMQEYKEVPGKYKALVILTDGENLEGDPRQAARQARQQGIKIFCVGIGTQEGELIQITNIFGEKEFLKDDEGRFIKSRLNEKLLQEIALATGGIYVRASGAQLGLDTIYEKDLSQMEKREIKSKMEKRFFERFQFPLSLAFILLVMETWLTTYRRETP